MKAHAIQLHKWGFNPIPLVAGEKRPMSSEWTKLTGLDAITLAGLFEAAGDCNVGIVTGNGLLVLDVDVKGDAPGTATLADLQAELGPLPVTVTARTASGGFHYYFLLPEDVTLGNTVGKLGPGIDTRCEGGQVVAPPSRLADGREYYWLAQKHPDSQSVSILPERWCARLLDLERAPRAKAEPARPGVEKLVDERDRAYRLKRVRAYLAAMPPAIAGQGGHSVAFDAACRAVERASCREDALQALLEWNLRCQPQWTVEELEHKLDDAEKRYSYGSAADRPRPVAAGTVTTLREPLRDDELDRQPSCPVLAAALEAFRKDRGRTVEEAFPGEDVVEVLKREVRTPSGPGRPTTYLPRDYQPIDWHGLQPSRYAHDERTSRPWRRRLASGEWTGGATEASLTHELENAGLNKRSATLFRARVRHVVDTVHLYDAPDQVFVERNGALYLNVYRKSLVEPEAGDWSALRKILDNLHDGKPDYLEWTLDWCAQVLQDIRNGKPQAPGVAIVFYGPAQGAGKGVFGEVLRALVGEHNSTIVRQADLDETFTGWAEGKLLVIANEVFSSENRTQSESNKLKPFISDPTISIRRMYSEVAQRPNVAAWLFFSNDMRPVALERLDRRYTVIRTGGRIDPALGREVAEDAHAGGPITRAFLHFLLNRDISRFQRHTPLTTEAKREVSYDTANSADKFVHELMHGEGFDSLTDAYRSEKGANELYAELAGEVLVERRVFYDVYRCWARANGYNALGSAQLFRLARTLGLEEERRRYAGRQSWFFTNLPGLPTEAPPAANEHPNVARARVALGAL